MNDKKENEIPVTEEQPKPLPVQETEEGEDEGDDTGSNPPGGPATGNPPGTGKP